MKISKIKILTLFAAILLLESCNSITPIPSERKTINYSGNSENAGIIGFLPDGSLEINGDGRDIYNGYVRRHGKDLIPPIGADYGITPTENNSYSMSLEAAEKWKEMQILEKMERINNAK